jgi:hypothetical protein
MRVSNALCDAAAVGYLGYDRMTKGNSSEVRQNMPLAVSQDVPIVAIVRGRTLKSSCKAVVGLAPEDGDDHGHLRGVGRL